MASHFDLPDVIPIFPLAGAVLLPHAQLPLNIFEPRYLAMTRDALASHHLIGMVQPLSGGTRPPIYPVGCVGRISSAEEKEDDRIVVTLSGLKRFRIVEELLTTTTYRQVRVDFSPFTNDDRDSETLVDGVRARVLECMHDYLKALGLDADWSAVESTHDDMLISALTMLCPFENAEKQALLEAETLAHRADILITLMTFTTQGQVDPPPMHH